MCVIAIVRDKRPTDEMIEQMADTNGDGMGLAFRQGGVVHWEKGIEDVEYMKELAASLPLPYILHFRIATHGKVCGELTHPFPVEKDAPLWQKGTTGGAVLFHNGSWGKWQDSTLEMAIHTPGLEVPDGEWSDTRAMAWVAAWKGKGALKLMGEKCVLFTPTEIDIYRKDWENVNGVFCSNKHFEYGRSHRFQNGQWVSTMCKFGQCTAKKDLDADGRCPKHPFPTTVTTPIRVIYPDRGELPGAALPGTTDATTPVVASGVTPRDSQLPGGADADGPFSLVLALAPLKSLRERGKLSRRQYRAAKKRILAQMESEMERGMEDKMVPPILLKSSARFPQGSTETVN